MVSFQLTDGTVVFISPCAIIAIEPEAGGTGSTIVAQGENMYRCSQSPEAVAEIVINAKKCCG